MRTAVKPVFVLIVAFNAALASSQTSVRMGLTIQDATEAAIPGAEIHLVERATGASFDAWTDGTGYAALKIPTGLYELSASAKGFETWKNPNLEIREPVEWRVTLKVLAQECPIELWEEPYFQPDRGDDPLSRIGVDPIVLQRVVLQPLKPGPAGKARRRSLFRRSARPE